MESDELLMVRALELAELGLRVGEMPIGAVVAIDGEVVGEAHTQERTQSRLLVHADLLALDAADRRLHGRRRRATLYVTLEPCLMCLGAAFTARIGAVVYALESPSDGGANAFRAWDASRRRKSMPGYSVPELRSGVRRADSARLFRRYAETTPRGWARDWAAELAALAEL
jgi:tRNA(adenine34) deaminase